MKTLVDIFMSFLFGDVAEPKKDDAEEKKETVRCPICHAPVKPEEMRKCDVCGRECCLYCLVFNAKNKTYECEDCW